jgi:O-antigen/teichoic acid export membrane protein
MKGTTVFGGVHIFNIFISILRGKLVAVFLGPAGMGVSALLSSTITTINLMSGLGLSMGAIRHISIANNDDDIKKLSLVTKIFRRLVLFTGIFGALICI